MVHQRSIYRAHYNPSKKDRSCADRPPGLAEAVLLVIGFATNGDFGDAGDAGDAVEVKSNRFPNSAIPLAVPVEPNVGVPFL
jgi:hypothetical protein